jgi:hypothetical protein
VLLEPVRGRVVQMKTVFLRRYSASFIDRTQGAADDLRVPAGFVFQISPLLSPNVSIEVTISTELQMLPSEYKTTLASWLEDLAKELRK